MRPILAYYAKNCLVSPLRQSKYFQKPQKHFAPDADSHPKQNEERLELLKMLQFHVLDTAFPKKSCMSCKTTAVLLLKR